MEIWNGFTFRPISKRNGNISSKNLHSQRKLEVWPSVASVGRKTRFFPKVTWASVACTAHASLPCKPLSAPPQKNLTRPTRLEMARNWTIVHFSLFSKTIIKTMKKCQIAFLAFCSAIHRQSSRQWKMSKWPFRLSAIHRPALVPFSTSGHAWDRPAL